MKSTLFILSLLACGLTCSGIAAADSIDPIYHLTFDGDYTNGVNLTNTGTNQSITAESSGGFLNYNTNGSYASETGYTYDNSSNYIKVSLNGAISYTSSFTITFAAKLTGEPSSTWSNLFQLGTNSSQYIRIQNATGNTFGLYSEGMGTITSDPSVSSLSTDSFTRITIVYDYVENEGGYFTMYSDGNVVSTTTSAVTASGSPTMLSIGGACFNGNRLNKLLIDEFGIYDAALTQEQVAGLVGKPTGTIPLDSPAVPEPATATLSLLALCGLAARRRRK